MTNRKTPFNDFDFRTNFEKNLGQEVRYQRLTEAGGADQTDGPKNKG